MVKRAGRGGNRVVVGTFQGESSMATIAPPPRPSKVWSPAPRPRLKWTRPSTAPNTSAKTLQWLTIGLIVVGVAARLTRYFLQFPIWCDEAFVCVNFLDRGYLALAAHGLEHAQVAPVLFLWTQLAAFRLFGASELALRLAPLLAGLASLGLFWRLAHITVKPLPAMLAVGLLAVSRWPVTMSAFAKPYSFDLLMALLLLVPAVEWLRRPDRLFWLALLARAGAGGAVGFLPGRIRGRGRQLGLAADGLARDGPAVHSSSPIISW